MSCTELVKSVSIENLVNQRAAVLEMIQQAVALLRDAAALASAAHVGFPDFAMNVSGSRQMEHRLTGAYRRETAELDALLAKVIDAGAWGYLMRESGLRSFMDARARQDWDEKVCEREVPPLTLENIRATFSALHDSRGDLFERGVLNLFWDYKTNRPFKFGKRIVVTHLRNSVTGSAAKLWGGGGSLGNVNYRRADALDDLSRVFHVLEGKPEPDHRSGWYSRLADQQRVSDPDPEDDYIAARCFRNGNAHITFKRPDLVEQMNRILAKHYPNALASEVR